MPPLVASPEFLYLHSWSSWYPSCFPNRHVEASCYKWRLKKSSLPYTCILSIQESCRNFSTHLWLLWVALGQLHKLGALDPFLGCQVLARMNSCKNIGGFQWMWMTVFRVRGSFIDMEAGGNSSQWEFFSLLSFHGSLKPEYILGRFGSRFACSGSTGMSLRFSWAKPVSANVQHWVLEFIEIWDYFFQSLFEGKAVTPFHFLSFFFF